MSKKKQSSSLKQQAISTIDHPERESTACKLSAMSLALVSVIATSQAWAQTDTPSSQSTTYTWNNGGDLSIASGVTIGSSSNNIAIDVSSTNLGTLTNQGTVLGSLASNAGIGLSNSNSATSITLVDNQGSILAITGIDNNGTIQTIDNSGHIGISIGIFNKGTIGSLTNSGTISGSYDGVLNLQGTIGTLTNSGLIYGNIVAGIASTGYIDTLINTGTIIGRTGVYIGGSGAGILSNSGLVSGSLWAFTLGASSNIGTFINSGTIAGSIFNYSSNALTISGGSGTIFGTITGYSGGIGYLSSAAGLVFNGGNQLLNDNVTAGTVTNVAGVVQVNNQITITGDYRQDSGATLLIGVTSNAVATGTVSADSGYGRLIVNGAATLDAGAIIALKPLTTYAYADGQRFVVLQSASANYDASLLTYSVAGYSGTTTGTIVTDGAYQDLVINLGSGNTVITNAATVDNAHAVLQGLYRYSGANQSLLDVLNPAVVLSGADAANRAGAQLSPVATGSAAINGANAAFGAVQGAAGGRLDTLRTAQVEGAGGVATGESTLSPALWGKAFGGHARQDERDGISGYHANFGGMLIGGDAQVAPDWRAGGLLSYARVSVGNEGNNSGSSASVNGYGVTAYASYDGHPWYVNLTAGAARQQYSTDRSISFTGFNGSNHGAFNGMVYTTTAQAGYPLAVGASTLTPLAGLSYTSLRQGGYTETGSAAALTVNGSSSTSLKSDIALKWERSLSTSYGELKPFAQLGWRHEFHATPLTTSAVFAADTTGTTAFTTQGASPLRNTGVLSLGATLLKTKNLSLAARYTLEATTGYRAHAGDVTVRWEY